MVRCALRNFVAFVSSALPELPLVTLGLSLVRVLLGGLILFRCGTLLPPPGPSGTSPVTRRCPRALVAAIPAFYPGRLLTRPPASRCCVRLLSLCVRVAGARKGHLLD